MDANDFYNRMMGNIRSMQDHSRERQQAIDIQNVLNQANEIQRQLQHAIQDQKLRMSSLSNACQTREKYNTQDIIDAEFEIISEDKK